MRHFGFVFLLIVGFPVLALTTQDDKTNDAFVFGDDADSADVAGVSDDDDDLSVTSLQTLEQRAQTFEREKDILRALFTHQKILALRVRAGQQMTEAFADTATKVGVALLSAKQTATAAEAAQVLKEALNVRLKLGQRGTEPYAHNLAWLGSALHSCGRHASAVLHLEESADIRNELKSNLTIEHCGVLQTLGSALHAANQSQRAADVLKRALVLRQQLNAMEHEDAASLLHSLAFALDATRQTFAAVQCLETEIATLEALQMTQSKVYADAVCELANLVAKIGNTARALVEAANCDAARKNGWSSHQLAKALRAAGNLEKAASKWSEVLESKSAQSDSLLRLEAVCSLAECLFSSSRFEDSLVHLMECHDGRSKRQKDSQEYISVLFMLGITLKKLNQQGRGLAVLEEWKQTLDRLPAQSATPSSFQQTINQVNEMLKKFRVRAKDSQKQNQGAEQKAEKVIDHISFWSDWGITLAFAVTALFGVASVVWVASGKKQS